MQPLELKLTDPQYERFLRLKADAKLQANEHLFDQMLAMLEDVYAARRDKYDEVVFRDSKGILPNGHRRERILSRKS